HGVPALTVKAADVVEVQVADGEVAHYVERVLGRAQHQGDVGVPGRDDQGLELRAVPAAQLEVARILAVADPDDDVELVLEDFDAIDRGVVGIGDGRPGVGLAVERGDSIDGRTAGNGEIAGNVDRVRGHGDRVRVIFDSATRKARVPASESSSQHGKLGARDEWRGDERRDGQGGDRNDCLQETVHLRRAHSWKLAVG